MKKRIGFIICTLLILFGVWNAYEYFSLKNIANGRIQQKIKIDTDQSIDLLGLMDSYGVNYHPSVPVNFQNLLEDSLATDGTLSSSLNLFNLYCNKTWELDGVFANDVTIGEFVKVQNYSLDFARHKYGDSIKTDLVYAAPEGLEAVSIREYTQQLEHPVILYSCTANDLFYYFSVSLESLTIGKIMTLIQKWKPGLDLLKDEVIHNIETLTNCNPNAQVFVMGIYVPTDNFFLQRLGSPFVNAVNGRIEAACNLYDNVYYVDCSSVCFSVLDGDFHPDSDGQHQIAAALMESINENLKEFPDTETAAHSDSPKQIDNPVQARVTADTVWKQMIETGLPLEDYVEYSVAFEQVLQLSGMDDITVEELLWLEDDFDTVLDGENLKWMKEALGIIATERKIHQGFDLKQYTLNEDVQNDKLSLIRYYD